VHQVANAGTARLDQSTSAILLRQRFVRSHLMLKKVLYCQNFRSIPGGGTTHRRCLPETAGGTVYEKDWRLSWSALRSSCGSV